MQPVRAVVIAAAAVALCVPGRALAADRPLDTGILDPQPYWATGVPWIGVTPELAVQRVRTTSSRAVRLYLYWRDVAPDPESVTRPAFDARAWNSPRYNWAPVDRVVQAAAARGLDVIFAVYRAPRWAEPADRPPPGRSGYPVPGTFEPSPSDFGDFAYAAADRYSGLHGLPRVRYWQAWNEANRRYFLYPQCDGGSPPNCAIRNSDERGRLASADHYRAMLAAFASAVRSVAVRPADAPNIVVTSGLASYGNWLGPAPITFMRRLLCLDGVVGCGPTPVPFDVWSHHPYTHGPPTESAPAESRNDVLLGDLLRMNRVLGAAWDKGRIKTDARPRFWVTEWSWDSRGPDRDAVPLALHARWVSEALYRMWRAGVSLAVWTQLRDYPPVYRTSDGKAYTYGYQAGLFYYGGAGAADDQVLGPGGSSDEPKRSLNAFRFPFVAFRGAASVYVWGRVPRAPTGTGYMTGQVRLQRRTARGRWQTPFARVTVNEQGIFAKRLATAMRSYAYIRAVVGSGTASVPFALTRPQWVEPEDFSLFGCFYFDPDYNRDAGTNGPKTPDCPWPAAR